MTTQTDKPKFWKSEKQRQIRKDLIKGIALGDHLMSDEDYNIDFDWLKKEDIDHLSLSDEGEY
tara:strand:+ start:75 stop:263 length:189 start_codon:yes stop_codon:yes gene_type:complete